MVWSPLTLSSTHFSPSCLGGSSPLRLHLPGREGPSGAWTHQFSHCTDWVFRGPAGNGPCQEFLQVCLCACVYVCVCLHIVEEWCVGVCVCICVDRERFVDRYVWVNVLRGCRDVCVCILSMMGIIIICLVTCQHFPLNYVFPSHVFLPSHSSSFIPLPFMHLCLTSSVTFHPFTHSFQLNFFATKGKNSE